MAITITPAAAGRIRSILEGKGTDTIRFGVKGGGCNGFTYLLDIGEAGEKDRISQFDGFKLAVDIKSYLLVNGTEIGWEEDLMGNRFVFSNPNATSECGCGVSVSIEPPDAKSGEEKP